MQHCSVPRSGKTQRKFGNQPLIRIVRKLYNGGMFDVLYLIALRMFESAYWEIQEILDSFGRLHATLNKHPIIFNVWSYRVKPNRLVGCIGGEN